MNFRQIAVTGLVAGMVAITGCSSNLPDNNQGNRNGQRVADAVNRRPDTYRGTRIGEDSTAVGHSIKNAANKAAHSVERATRQVGDTVAGRNTERNVTRNTNRNVDRTANHTMFYNNKETRKQLVNNQMVHTPAATRGITTTAVEAVPARPVRKATHKAVVRNSAVRNNEVRNNEFRNNEFRKNEPHVNKTHKTVVTRSANHTPATITPVDTKRAEVKRSAGKTHKPVQTVRTTRGTTRYTGNGKNIAKHLKSAPPLTINHQGTGVRKYNADLQVPFKVAPDFTMGFRKPVAARPVAINTTHKEQTVAVLNTDDDLAFFRKKTEAPQIAPAPTQEEKQPQEQSFNDFEDNYSDNYDDTDSYEIGARPVESAPVAPAPTKIAPTKITPTATPAPAARAMK